MVEVKSYKSVEYIEFEITAQDLSVIEKSEYGRNPDKVKPIKGATKFRFFNQHEITTSTGQVFSAPPEKISKWYDIKN